jgi:signal transduction histidine kinase
MSIPERGLGLTICKKIMDNHNGFIRLNTKPGVGSTFYGLSALVTIQQ